MLTSAVIRSLIRRYLIDIVRLGAPEKCIFRKINKMCEKTEAEKADLESVGTLPQDDVVNKTARATAKHDEEPRMSDSEIPPKKRKTRRGKSKRKNIHPYRKSKSNSVVKPEAPYNSNRFLIEDHGDLDGIDEEFKKTDQASTSTVTRTRDSSFSMDSDGEFYSTPDDEEVFLIKDFDDQYESLQAERLQAMSKDELIQEFLMLESKLELVTKRLRAKTLNGHVDLTDLKLGGGKSPSQVEIQKLIIENESLRRENESLRNKQDSSSDSADTETDSSDTCSSSTSSLSRPDSPVDYRQTNGHPEHIQPV